ncbi:unnamed protein product [Rotaria sp. Silwood1]|nr:unnamed protein product [Rotaria sp. Silwood1]
MKTQSELFGKFVEFMNGTMATNTALIEQRTALYNLIEKSNDNQKVTYFMGKADNIKISDAKRLMDIGFKKVKELNLESSEELKYLESRLENVLGIMNHNNRQLLPVYNWRDARSPKLFYPAVGFKLEKLVVRCEIAYRLTKKGKFQDQQ